MSLPNRVRLRDRVPTTTGTPEKLTERDLSYDIAFFRAFQRPAWVVMMVAQMLLGLALAITLIVKFYMLVFTSHVCVDSPEVQTLGNLIRCTETLEIVAHFLLGVAGFRFAAFMFHDRPRLLLGPIMVGLVGVFFLFLSGLTPQGATWPIAAIIVSLLVSISAIVAGQTVLSRLGSPARDTKKET